MNLSELLNGSEAVIFDMDGTMFDTEPLHAVALKNTIETLNNNYKLNILLSSNDIEERFVGLGDQDVYAYLVDSPELISETDFLNLKNDLFINELNKLSKDELNNLMTPGLVDLIEGLSKQDKKLAVVSASEVEVVHSILEKSDIKKYFNIVKGRTDTFATKPSPDPYLTAMRELMVSSKCTTIFEDSNAGLDAANSSGANVVHVKHYSNVKSMKTKHRINHFNEWDFI